MIGIPTEYAPLLSARLARESVVPQEAAEAAVDGKAIHDPLSC